MSLLNFFTSKPGLGQPVAANAGAATATGPAPVANGNQASGGQVGRRAERNEHREQLYIVVRDAMTRAGVLSASYKFKVLSLDSRGTNFLVMMDLVSSAAEESGRLSEIEALILHNARVRHEFVVAAVYWRLSDYVTTGLQTKTAQGPVATTRQAAGLATSEPSSSKHKPVQVDEMLAFKQAFAAAPGGLLSASGQVTHSGRRGPALPVASEALDHDHEDDRVSPLGPTQYGELN